MTINKNVLDYMKHKSSQMNVENKKSLMSFEEFYKYLGIGKTKARELTSKPDCKYVVRIGRRVFIHRELLENELKKVAKYQLKL